MISGFDRTMIGLDKFSCVVFAFLGHFGRVLASLGSVPYSFATPLALLDAYLSFEYVTLWTTRNGRRTQRENPSNLRTIRRPDLRLRPDVRDWISGLLSDFIRSDAFRSARADLIFWVCGQLASFGPLVQFLGLFYTGSRPFFFSSRFLWFFPQFSPSISKFLDPLDSSLLSLQILLI